MLVFEDFLVGVDFEVVDDWMSDIPLTDETMLVFDSVVLDLFRLVLELLCDAFWLGFVERFAGVLLLLFSVVNDVREVFVPLEAVPFI